MLAFCPLASAPVAGARAAAPPSNDMICLGGAFGLAVGATIPAAARRSAPDPGTLAFTPVAARLAVAGASSVAAGAAALTGQVAAFSAGRLVSADFQSFTHGGKAAGLTAALLPSLAAGSFALAGQSLAGGRCVSMALDPGSDALAGGSMVFAQVYATSASPASFEATGQEARLIAFGWRGASDPAGPWSEEALPATLWTALAAAAGSWL